MGLYTRDYFPAPLCRRIRNYVLKSEDLKRYRKGYRAIDLVWYGKTGPLFDDIVSWAQSSISEIRNMHCISAWCFVYDPICAGVPIHCDDGKMTVNIWLTPNSSMILDKYKNGLRIYNVSAPSSWKFETANGDTRRIRNYIASREGSHVVIPYSHRRVVVFPSRHFHETDSVHTRHGLTHQRLSCTLLFG